MKSKHFTELINQKIISNKSEDRSIQKYYLFTIIIDKFGVWNIYINVTTVMGQRS